MSGKTEEKKPLPPFGYYCQVPNWFITWCVPKLSNSAVVVWLYIWSRFRWKTGVPVAIPIRTIMQAAGVSAGIVKRSMGELLDWKLIVVIRSEKPRHANCYTIPVYTAAQARDNFKNKAKSVFRKKKQNFVPKHRKRKPKVCDLGLNTVQDCSKSVQ